MEVTHEQERLAQHIVDALVNSDELEISEWHPDAFDNLKKIILNVILKEP